MAIGIPQSFTVEYPGRADRLLTECGVCKHFDPKISKEKHPKTVFYNIKRVFNISGVIISDIMRYICGG